MKAPDFIEIDCKVTSTGYLQVSQWSSKGGIRPPPINGNSRETYYHDRILKAKDAEIAELKSKLQRWEDAHSELIGEVELRKRVAELEAILEARGE